MQPSYLQEHLLHLQQGLIQKRTPAHRHLHWNHFHQKDFQSEAYYQVRETMTST